MNLKLLSQLFSFRDLRNAILGLFVVFGGVGLAFITIWAQRTGNLDLAQFAAAASSRRFDLAGLDVPQQSSTVRGLAVEIERRDIKWRRHVRARATAIHAYPVGYPRSGGATKHVSGRLTDLPARRFQRRWPR